MDVGKEEVKDTIYDRIPEYEIDPSVEDLLREWKERGKKEEFILLDDIDTDGKKILVKQKIELPVRKDYRDAVHLYMNEETIQYMKRLTTSTINLLVYVMQRIEQYGNEVDIDVNLASADLGIEYSSVYKARIKLLKDKWIYKTKVKNRFTINLLRFSNGDVPHILNKYDRRKERVILQKEINKQIEERELAKNDN